MVWLLLLSLATAVLCGDVSIQLPVHVSSSLTINNSQHNLTTTLAEGQRFNQRMISKHFDELPTEQMAATLLQLLDQVGDMEIIDKVKI